MSRVLSLIDHLFDRIYGSKYNPLYQSGTLALLFLLLTVLTGFYLFIFYKISSPYQSVSALQDQIWAGRWIRSLHTYSSNAALLAVFIHALRLFIQRRSWGPRALAWVSGVVLTGVILFTGWTGLILVWDRQGQILAVEGARIIDLFPFFAEPISRSFTQASQLPRSFFFLNLFIHLAIPLGMILLMWIHTMKLSRPTLLPPKKLLWGAVGSLWVLSFFWPASLGKPADLLALPGKIPLNLFFSFWIPLAEWLRPGWLALIGGGGFLLGILVPWITRPRLEDRRPPSSVDESSCTGCTHCYQDCPYNAIQMVKRMGKGSEFVARVDPLLCVSCGICSASCAPMGVGPPARTGKEQLKAIQGFLKTLDPNERPVIGFVCKEGVSESPSLKDLTGLALYPVGCGGSLHTSVIEYVLRWGASGALIFSCPPRNCVNREGVKWLEARLYQDHEAELREVVDKRRVRLVSLGKGDGGEALQAFREFEDDLRTMKIASGEKEIEISQLCESQEGDDVALRSKRS